MNRLSLKGVRILLSLLFAVILGACEFAPTSTTVSIKNNTDTTFYYWLKYNLADFSAESGRAPSLASGEEKNWDISGDLSAAGAKDGCLTVVVMTESEYNAFKAGDYKDRSDSELFLLKGKYKEASPQESYTVTIEGTASDYSISIK